MRSRKHGGADRRRDDRHAGARRRRGRRERRLELAVRLRPARLGRRRRDAADDRAQQGGLDPGAAALLPGGAPITRAGRVRPTAPLDNWSSTTARFVTFRPRDDSERTVAIDFSADGVPGAAGRERVLVDVERWLPGPNIVAIGDSVTAAFGYCGISDVCTSLNTLGRELVDVAEGLQPGGRVPEAAGQRLLQQPRQGPAVDRTRARPARRTPASLRGRSSTGGWRRRRARPASRTRRRSATGASPARGRRTGIRSRSPTTRPTRTAPPAASAGRRRASTTRSS